MAATKSLPDIDCACASVRRAARLITQLYSHEMGDQIEPGQFAMLVAIEKMPGCTPAALGRVLGFDKTTLSRGLAILKRNAWIEPAEPVSGYRLTKSGVRILAETKPGWRRAQQKLRAALPAGEDWLRMLDVFNQSASAALKARGAK